MLASAPLATAALTVVTAGPAAAGGGSMKAGYIYTVAGNGTNGYSGDGGLATSAEVGAPYGVAVDSVGDLLIADTQNNVVRVVAATNCSSDCAYGLSSTTAGDIYTIAGNSNYGRSGDDGPATAAELGFPTGVTVDPAGNLLIADAGNGRIRMVAAANCSANCAYGLSSTTAGYIYTVAGGSRPCGGAIDSVGDGCPATQANMNYPYKVTVDSAGDLLIPDFENSRIRMVAAQTCASSCPYGLPSTIAGDIYTVAGNGTAGYAGDDGPASSAELQNPLGAAADAAGNLFIGDVNNERVRMVAAANCSASCAYGLSSTTSGDIYTIAGDGAYGYSGDGGPAMAARLFSPADVVVDPSGDVIIGDANNSRIRMVAGKNCTSNCPFALPSMTAGDIYTIGGDGTSGYAGDGGPATSAEVSGEIGLALDSAGDLFTAGNEIREIYAGAVPTCSPSIGQPSCTMAGSAAVSGGTLSIEAPGTLTWSASLTGVDQSAGELATLEPIDATGSGAGWQVTVTSTTFTSTGNGATLPVTALSVNGGGSAGGSDPPGATCAPTSSCAPPTPSDSVVYPLQVPAGASAPAAVDLYEADGGTGLGAIDLASDWWLAIPAAATAGIYTSTISLAIASGP